MNLSGSAPRQGSREAVRPEADIDRRRVVPFGPSGAGLFTGHPIGLVVVVGMLFMGFVGLPGAHWFYAGALLFGGMWGFFLWWRHR
jgi:hypothetical protein